MGMGVDTGGGIGVKIFYAWKSIISNFVKHGFKIFNDEKVDKTWVNKWDLQFLRAKPRLDLISNSILSFAF